MMSARTVRGLDCILVGLLLLIMLMMACFFRPQLPGRPLGLTILFPFGVLLAGSLIFSFSEEEVPSSSLVFYLQASALAAFGLTPFFVWQFLFPYSLYFLICGFLFALSFQFFLICLSKIVEKYFYLFGYGRLAGLSRLAGSGVIPFMGGTTFIIYFHVLRLGQGRLIAPVMSPYAVWTRLSLFFRFLFGLPFFVIIVLLTILVIMISKRFYLLERDNNSD